MFSHVKNEPSNNVYAMNFTNRSFLMQILLMYHPAYRREIESSGPFEEIYDDSESMILSMCVYF